MSKCSGLVLSLLLAFTAAAQPIQWPIAAGGNGHYYEFVAHPNVDWTTARNAASARSHVGLRGHLATFAYQNEWEFALASLGVTALNCWIGADQPALAAEPIGGWRWVSGEPLGFSAWRIGEPNQSSGDEDGMAISASSPPEWVDLRKDVSGLAGYIVEYEPASINYGLIAHYPLDTSAQDVSGHGLNGIAEGGVSYFFDPTRGSRVINLDGSTGLIEINHGGQLSFDVDSESFTFSAWIWAEPHASNTTIIQDRWGSNGAVSYSFGLNISRPGGPPPPGFVSATWYGVAQNLSIEVVSPSTPFENRWRHVVVTFDALTGTKLMYIDGSEVASGQRPSAPFTQASSATTTTLGGGWYPTGVHHFRGRLDDIRFYNRALAPHEVVAVGLRDCDPDFNRDGNVDQDDVAALINVIAGGNCP
jgi:hypothetical protein